MKKLLLLTILSLFFSTLLFAQNTFPATGNVGIGTNNPYGPLNVDPQGVGGITIGNPNVNSGDLPVYKWEFLPFKMGIHSFKVFKHQAEPGVISYLIRAEVM